MDEVVAKFYAYGYNKPYATSPGFEVKLKAVSVDSDPFMDENRRFHQATPNGELTMWVDNPNVKGFFEPGETYYLTFTKVSKDQS